LFEPQASFCNRLKQVLDLSKTLAGSENDSLDNNTSSIAAFKFIFRLPPGMRRAGYALP